MYLISGSKGAVLLEEALLKPKLLKDTGKLSPVYQTSILEAKYSLDVQFVPKNVAFSYWGDVCEVRSQETFLLCLHLFKHLYICFSGMKVKYISHVNHEITQFVRKIHVHLWLS